MTIQTILVVGSVAWAISGCARRAEPPEPEPWGQAWVDYQLAAYERLDVTTMHIELDGAITRTRTDEPVARARLDPATLGDVMRKIEDAAFPALAPQYGCGGCADDAVYRISVHVDGAPYTVQTDSMAAFPDRLRPVIDTLREISERALDGQ